MNIHGSQVTDALPGPMLSAVATVQGYADWMAGGVRRGLLLSGFLALA